jgi:hypothetical protein
MKKVIYCTYFNKGYLGRGIILLRSLAKFVGDCSVEVLCFDDETFTFLSKFDFKNVVPVSLCDFESRHPELVAVKSARSCGEYFFTCTSSWTLDVFLRHPEASFVVYLDADMKFFASPDPVLDMMDGKDIIICDHNFERDYERQAEYGRFNVGFVAFRNSQTGFDCLSRWAADCIDWCYDRLEDGKFADQKYLDAWPERYGERLSIAPRGVDLGPWGIGRDELSEKDGVPYIAGEPIVLFHYQGLRLFNRRHYYLGYYYHYPVSKILEILYEPYIRELQLVEDEFGLAENCGNARYVRGNFLYRLFTGYWLGWSKLADMQLLIQRLFR